MLEPRRSTERQILLDAVLSVRDILVACADESERIRTLAPAAVDALHKSGLFALAAPRAVGGRECDPVTQMEVFEATARIDSSAGWCLMIGAMTGALAGGYLPDVAASRIFGGPFPTFAGLQLPCGVAKRTASGFVLNGRWPFGSGVRHAQWVFTGAMIEPPGDAPPDAPAMISVAVPASHVQIEDTWHAAGLRGSGSEHYRMEGVFVPNDFACPFPAAPPRRGGPLFRLPMLALLTAAHVGFALGVARRALDEIAEAAPRRLKTWPQATLGSLPAFHMDLGRAEAKLSASRAYAVSVLDAMWERARAGQALSLEDWSPIRLATTYVTDTAADVATFAYRSGGASALYASSPLQRAFRDLHAATQHVAASDDAYEFAGRLRLGLARPHPLLAPRAEA